MERYVVKNGASKWIPGLLVTGSKAPARKYTPTFPSSTRCRTIVNATANVITTGIIMETIILFRFWFYFAIGNSSIFCIHFWFVYIKTGAGALLTTLTIAKRAKQSLWETRAETKTVWIWSAVDSFILSLICYFWRFLRVYVCVSFPVQCLFDIHLSCKRRFTLSGFTEEQENCN